jgi:hypothetical protein
VNERVATATVTSFMEYGQSCEELDRTNRHKVAEGRIRRVECRDAFDRRATGLRERNFAQPSEKESERSETLLRFPPQKDLERGNSNMSAIGITGAPTAYKKKRRPMVIGAHADYRKDDFFFPRTQSLPMRDAEWESRIRPMHSWSEIALYSVGIFALCAVAVSFT